MTEDNKPTWQYVPPASPTEGSSIDATRYMKGAPRRTANPVQDTTGSNSVNTGNTESTENSDRSDPKAYHEEASEENPMNEHYNNNKETYDSTPSMSYQTEEAPAASEYTTEQHSGGSQPRREGYQRPNGHYRGPRREGRHDAHREDRRRHHSERQGERTYAPQAHRHAPSTPNHKNWVAWVRFQWKRLVNKVTGKKEEAVPMERGYNRENNRGEGRGEYRGSGPRREGRSGGGRGYRGGRGGRGRGGNGGGRSGGYNRGPRS